MNDPSHRVNIETVLTHMRQHVSCLTGSEEARGFQIAALIRMLGNLYDNIPHEHDQLDDLSGPRIGLLFRLFIAEQRGNLEGITPTELSRNQHVSRNTISALLRGLEDQNLIERKLDPQDRRLFRIHLTETGRETLKTIGPQRISRANQVVSSLSQEEQEQLITLLGKLYNSLQTHAGCPVEKGKADLPGSTNNVESNT